MESNKERSKSTIDQSSLFKREKFNSNSESPNKIDIGISTGPDILTMLTELKQNKERRSESNNQNMEYSNQNIEHANQNKDFKVLGMQNDIQEEDCENTETDLSIANSKISAATENINKSASKHTRKLHDNYGPVVTNYNYKRLKDNNSANRYKIPSSTAKPQLSLNRYNSKREKSLAKDRLHIVDRISTSLMNGEDISDFSDIKSVKDSRNKYNASKYSTIDQVNLKKNALYSSHNHVYKTFASEEDTRTDEFGQYNNSDSIDEEIERYLNKNIHNNQFLRKRRINQVFRYKNSTSPSLEVKHAPKIEIKRPKRDVTKGLKLINKNLDPRFKLAKVDIEEMQNSQTLQLNNWNREPSVNFVIGLMKQERRNEYWKRRVRIPNDQNDATKVPENV